MRLAERCTRARGILAFERGEYAEARRFFLESLAFARAHRDPSLETTALLNLGSVGLQNEHYDQALDWSTSAYRAGLELGDENMSARRSGNLGWAYFQLGDTERALALFIDAENRAAKLGSIRRRTQMANHVRGTFIGQAAILHERASLIAVPLSLPSRSTARKTSSTLLKILRTLRSTPANWRKPRATCSNSAHC